MFKDQLLHNVINLLQHCCQLVLIRFQKETNMRSLYFIMRPSRASTEPPPTSGREAKWHLTQRAILSIILAAVPLDLAISQPSRSSRARGWQIGCRNRGDRWIATILIN